MQYQRFQDGAPSFGLLELRRTGELVFDLPHTPRLLALAGSARLYFLDPGAGTANRWVAARPRD